MTAEEAYDDVIRLVLKRRSELGWLYRKANHRDVRLKLYSQINELDDIFNAIRERSDALKSGKEST